MDVEFYTPGFINYVMDFNYNIELNGIMIFLR